MSGDLTPCCTIPADSSSFIADGGLNSRGERVLYAVQETGDHSGVVSFAGMSAGGSMASGAAAGSGAPGEADSTAEGWRRTGFCSEVGADPCYILPVPSANLVVTADYSGGSYSVFATSDGVVGSRVQVAEFPSRYWPAMPADGASPVAGCLGVPVAGRQDGSHIHQVRRIPDSICRSLGLNGDFFLASDLGNDVIRILRLNDKPVEDTCANHSTPILDQAGIIECGTGSGPRHMEFNEAAGMLYCITEISGEVICWKIGADLKFSECQRLVADRFNAGGSADIHLSPDGEWLLVSHRLKGDGLSIFKVAADGSLTPSGYVATDAHPRNFCFSPDGRYVLVACRDTRTIQVFAFNGRTGSLRLKSSYTLPEPDSDSLSEDRPVCLLFL